MPLSTPAPAVRLFANQSFRLKAVLASAFAVAFAFPLLGSLWFDADPLTIANESIAYRFVFSERLLNGEGASVWVLAGFLTTAIQNNILQIINYVSLFPPNELFHRIHLYAYSYSAIVTLAGAAIFVAAVYNRRFESSDLALLAFPALGPLVATKVAGFYYYTLPDYYHLNVLLTVVAVWIFQYLWHGREHIASPYRTTFLLGLFVGLMCGNKITMLVVGAPLFAPVFFRAPLSLSRCALMMLLAAVATLCGFLFVIAWFYLFDLTAVPGMFRAWLATIKNPGGESNFWSSDFRNYMTGYSYGYIIAFYLLAVGTAFCFALRENVSRHRSLVALVIIFFGGVAWGYFIYKRPAGTTFFEAAVALFGFGAMALTTCARHHLGTKIIILCGLLWAAYSIVTFEFRHNLAVLAESRPWADRMWRLHGDLLDFSRGHLIVVIHPDNNYGYGGVAEFLLKGTSDIPTWNVSDKGRPILERFAPGMSFRHEYSGTHPNAPFPDGAVIFWVDRPEFPLLVDKYSRLREAHIQALVKKEWTIEIQGHVTVKAHAIKLPSLTTIHE